MKLRTLLSQARGLGPAKEGVSHWWMQRITAVALIPLIVWFAFAVAMLGDSSFYHAIAWVSSPLNTVLLIVLIIATFYHLQLGLQVILEDYVHLRWLKISSIMCSNFTCILLAIIGIIAVLKIALGVDV